MITKTIGGDRVGSGKKMQAHLHNYFRSTHNLSEKWASSMGSGILYPCCVKLGMRGDSFDIDVSADLRTIPTKGPLFGSYKVQIDFYQCPIRLYQGILHNNPLAIGLKMSEVKFPILKVEATHRENEVNLDEGKFNESSLLKYLGMSGLGHVIASEQLTNIKFNRSINAIPALAYYDIFKTYYANKQEENAYMIGAKDIQEESPIIEVSSMEGEGEAKEKIRYNPYKEEKIYPNNFPIDIIADTSKSIETHIENDLFFNSELLATLVTNEIVGVSETILTTNKKQITIAIINDEIFEELYSQGFTIRAGWGTGKIASNIELKPFKLTNIDDMRYDILSSNRLGEVFEISQREHNYLPYSQLVEQDGDFGRSLNYYPLNGLVLKTYQNDIYNNWLNTEWIEGENGINELSKVSVTDGNFSMDALNFAQKLYNMLNRIAVAGATYEDWQDVVYEEVKRRQIESPIFIGGMSQELMFDEVIQSAPANGNPLGTLGGRGKNVKDTQKGGKFHVKCDEACFIIGIISLTPRQFYTQGNEFYMTDVLSMDDIHKPAMDGIGFQDLIGERLAWFDTQISRQGNNQIITRSKVGKLPAWIEYMTSVDKAYGDFAQTEGKGYMILNRNYEATDEGLIKDATTYIDPSKYNYAFAYTQLDAQNFWCELLINIKARRLMSARLIPNV